MHTLRVLLAAALAASVALSAHAGEQKYMGKVPMVDGFEKADPTGQVWWHAVIKSGDDVIVARCRVIFENGAKRPVCEGGFPPPLPPVVTGALQ